MAGETERNPGMKPGEEVRLPLPITRRMHSVVKRGQEPMLVVCYSVARLDEEARGRYALHGCMREQEAGGGQEVITHLQERIR